MRFLVLAALFAPASAFACAMPHREEVNLARLMAEIDEAAAPAPVAEAAAPAPAPAQAAPAPSAPAAPPTVIPEVAAKPKS